MRFRDSFGNAARPRVALAASSNLAARVRCQAAGIGRTWQPAIAHLACRARRLEQHSRHGIVTRHRTNVIHGWKNVFVALFYANFRTKIDWHHAAHFIEDLEKLGRGHVMVIGVRRHPQLHDGFPPAVGMAAAIDGFEQGGF
jgi:hypothetical protein